MKPFQTCKVNFGAPLWPSDFGEVYDPRLGRRLTDALMFEIAKLSGQTYVDTYGGEKKKAFEESGTRPMAPAQDAPSRPTRPTARAEGAAAPKSTKPARPSRPSRPTASTS